MNHDELLRELAASEARRRAKAAAEPETVKLPRHRMPDRSYGGPKWDRTEDFVPPVDLTEKRRAR